MAYFHMHAQVIGRSQGRYAVAAAAYRAGIRLYCERSGQWFDFRGKQDVIRSGELAPVILVPPWGPTWAGDRALLYNAIEAAEKRRDSQLLREFDLAIPKELSEASAKGLLVQWNEENFLVHGLVSDLTFHRGYRGLNRHAHLLVSMRCIEPQGFSTKKATALNHPSLCEKWRESWERLCNQALESEGCSERISRLTLSAQGVDRAPQRHMGQALTAMRRKGTLSEQDWARSLFKTEVERDIPSSRVSIAPDNIWRQNPGGRNRLVPEVGNGLQRLENHTGSTRKP